MPSSTRRDALCNLAVLSILVTAGTTGRAATAQAAIADASRPVAALESALLRIMQAGERTAFTQRYEMLAPVVQSTFDLRLVLQLVVGFGWNSMSPSQQQTLLTAFTEYSVATWVSNFNSYSGQRFQFLPNYDRSIGSTQVVVATQIVSASGTTHRLDFVMRLTPAGWRAVDVLADNISRLATLRSDFSSLVASDSSGANLAQALRKKATDLATSEAPV
jgi:phospholipid transport system substrate-binding protein